MKGLIRCERDRRGSRARVAGVHECVLFGSPSQETGSKVDGGYPESFHSITFDPPGHLV